MYIDYLSTPLGEIEIQANSIGITKVIFINSPSKTVCPNFLTEACKEQLSEYFNKSRKTFSVPLDLKGTRFQESVWESLIKIPFGESCSYMDIANDIGNPKSFRAVGRANGNNSIGIIIPCHRVIGKNKSLVGYGGGLDRKAWLLKHENIRYLNSEIKTQFKLPL